MKILHVLHSHGYGGAESHALTLMKALREAGHELMLAGPPDAWLAERCQEEGLPLHPLHMHGLMDLASHLSLRRLVARWSPQVVHGHLVRGAHYAGWSAWRQPGVHAVCTAHATTAHKHMRRCEHVIAVSGAVRDNLLRHGYAKDRISLVYNGMPDPLDGNAPPDRLALRRELGIPDDVAAIVNVGRFVRDKGQDLLVKALSAMTSHATLYLIGETNTSYGQQVRQLAGDSVRVKFLGYRADVPRLLPAFDAYASASRREALGLSLVEAAAAGLPTVATAVGGVPEVVRDGVTGHLVPSEDIAALGKALDALLSSPAHARSLGDAARAHYLDTFTVQHMLEQTLRVYRATTAHP